MRCSVLAGRPPVDAPLAELIEDCLWLTITAPRLCRAPRPPHRRAALVDDRAVAMLEGYPEYGG